MPPDAHIHRRRGFSAVWLIPIIAAVIAAYLGWQTLSRQGPLITLTFNTGDGLTAGQTQVKHKAVQLGRVETVELSPDMSHVIVRIRMQSNAERELTDHANFWVVRPRFDAGNISGIETLISGAYIEMDPGPPGGRPKLSFTGLENPPGVRSDEPGTTYVLKANTIGSLNQGSPVFYRDISVGEVLGYDQPGLDGKITVHIFVRAPFDKYVRNDTRFWNTSGVQVNIGASGIQLQIESLQAVLSGGVAFSTPPEARDEPPAVKDAGFNLYKDYDTAVAAASKEHIPLLAFFQGSVRGLGNGSPVELFGIRVGSVTDMHLEYDATTQSFRVPVHMEVEPDNLTFPEGRGGNAQATIRGLVRKGLRASLETSNYLTGQMVVALEIPPNAQPAEARMEGDEIVLPGEAGGLGGITTALSDIANKLDRMPFEQIGQNLNNTLASLNGLVGGPDVRNAVRDLSSTLASVRELVRQADTGMTPVLRRLPQLESNLEDTMKHANSVLGSVNTGYGQNSEFSRGLERLLDQANDTLRSVRQLADFLSRHPEALIRGRAGEAAQR